MMVEKVPDSTYENVGGLDKQIKEIKEVIELPVKHPELFDALGIAQPKVWTDACQLPFFIWFPCYSAPVGEQSIAISLCVCLSVCEHISGTAGPIFTTIFAQIPCGHRSVLLWRRCDTLCTSGFMDDVTLGRNGPYGSAWKAEPLTYCH